MEIYVMAGVIIMATVIGVACLVLGIHFQQRAIQHLRQHAIEIRIFPPGPINDDTEFVWVNNVAFVNARKHEQVVNRLTGGVYETKH